MLNRDWMVDTEALFRHDVGVPTYVIIPEDKCTVKHPKDYDPTLKLMNPDLAYEYRNKNATDVQHNVEFSNHTCDAYKFESEDKLAVVFVDETGFCWGRVSKSKKDSERLVVLNFDPNYKPDIHEFIPLKFSCHDTNPELYVFPKKEVLAC